MGVVFICNLMRIGRWSELSVDSVCQEHEVMRNADANETSGELGSALGGTLVGMPQLRIPWLDQLIESARIPRRMVCVKITKDNSVLWAPVAVLKAAFCAVCIFLKLESLAVVLQTGAA